MIAQGHFNMCKEAGVKLDNDAAMSMYKCQ